MITEKCKALELKKQTLTAWTRILLGRGEIDVKKYNRMLVLIDKLTEKHRLPDFSDKAAKLISSIFAVQGKRRYALQLCSYW